MFGKNFKRVPIKNEFGDKEYQMKDTYKADTLVVARFERVSSRVTDFGPMVEKTEQKYTFETIINGEKTRYREIFTGFITGDESIYFDLPYVVDVQPFTDCFPDTAGIEIPKLSLIWTQNDINYPKGKEKKKTK